MNGCLMLGRATTLECRILGLGRRPETPPFENAVTSHNSVFEVRFRERAIGNGFWENGAPMVGPGRSEPSAFLRHVPNRKRP